MRDAFETWWVSMPADERPDYKVAWLVWKAAALAQSDGREVRLLRDALMKACGDDVEMCRRYLESLGVHGEPL